MSNIVDPRIIFLQQSKIRLYKGLSYLTLFIYVVFVSACAFLADYVLVVIIENIVARDISKYPMVSTAFDWFKIGSAFLVFIAAGIHSFFSAWSQIKFELDTIKEPVLANGEVNGEKNE